MITLSKSGNSVTFTFDENSGYLQNGTIDVPVNSLSLILDESDMATFRKSASNDIFVSALVGDFGMSKSELEAWYKANMVGSTGGGGGVTPEEVQGMIDESISGKADTTAVTESISEATSGKVDTSTYNTYTAATNTAISGKQDTLVEGVGIQISGDVITATYDGYPIIEQMESVFENRTEDFYMIGGVDCDDQEYGYVRLDDQNGSNWTFKLEMDTHQWSLDGYEGSEDGWTAYMDIEWDDSVNLFKATVKQEIPRIGDAICGRVIDPSWITVEMSGTTKDAFDAVFDNFDAVFDNLEHKAEKLDAVHSAEYVSSTARINFKNIDGEIISYIDASDFIVDGMIDDVRIDTISGVSYLVIDFNTASGKEDIKIPLTDIFDPSNYYTKTEVDASLSGKADTTAVTEAISAATDDMATKTWVGEQGYLTEHQSLSAYSTTEEVNSAITEATSGKVDTSTFETYSGSVETALSGKQDTLSAGTNITISGNVISAEGGGKAIEAGRGISITTGETADTVSFDLPIYKTVSGSGFNSGHSLVLNASSEPSVNTFKPKYNTYINCISPYVDNTSGSNNLIMGESCSAMSYASNSFVGGSMSKIGDDKTFAFGAYSEALAVGAVAFGYDSQAFKPQVSKGFGSFACGGGTSANTVYSFATGYHTFTTRRSEFASGQYNNSVSASTTFGDSGNTLFSVGNGTAENARHNAFEIRQNGDIYISLNGQDVKLQDQLGGGSITIDPSLDSGSTNAVANSAITASIAAVSGSIPTVTSAVTSGSTDVVESGAVYDQLGGLKLVKLTQAEYDALVSGGTVDANTLYIITNVVN